MYLYQSIIHIHSACTLFLFVYLGLMNFILVIMIRVVKKNFKRSWRMKLFSENNYFIRTKVSIDRIRNLKYYN